jgi:uncharacterized protein YggU (UPF0235/DUF167 family)
MRIEVRVKPNSRTEEVIEEGGFFIVKVKESPLEGKANKATIRLLAKHLGIPVAQVKILKGKSSRNKIIEVL